MSADSQIIFLPMGLVGMHCNSSVHAEADKPHLRCRHDDQGQIMKNRLRALRTNWANKQQGGMGYVLLWLLGVPIPVLILISLLRGCN
jgi:hypothetical protein